MILITGASRGIGKFLLKRFVSEGRKTAGIFNKTSPSREIINYLTKVDINNSFEIEEWIKKVTKDSEKIVLINCAGTNYNCFGHKSDPKLWAEVIQTNLVGTFNVIRQVLPLMREKGYGRIINFSSIVAETGIPGTSAYAASKSGLWGMTRALAVENAKKGITINNLNLGYFDIGMITEVPEDFQKIIKNKIPMGDFGNPNDILNGINFIIDSEYLTGTSLDINGGLY